VHPWVQIRPGGAFYVSILMSLIYNNYYFIKVLFINIFSIIVFNFIVAPIFVGTILSLGLLLGFFLMAGLASKSLLS
jgi:hypothetical protein